MNEVKLSAAQFKVIEVLAAGGRLVRYANSSGGYSTLFQSADGDHLRASRMTVDYLMRKKLLVRTAEKTGLRFMYTPTAAGRAAVAQIAGVVA